MNDKMRNQLMLGLGLLLLTCAVSAETLTAALETPALHNYDDAPMTPDADDPAIWRNAVNPKRSLVFASLKDSGLQVYTMQGEAVQTIYPENHPAVSELDPPVPGSAGALGETSTCTGSKGTYGRFNNVDVVYGVTIPTRGVVDLVIATDRGCDKLRIFAIDPSHLKKPLVEITDAHAPRVFPDRIVQPSQYQPATDVVAGYGKNPVDDQNTAYGLSVYKAKNKVRVFVSQRSRSRLKELVLRPTPLGTVSYRSVRDYRFPVAHTIARADGTGTTQWEACREDPNDDLQFEGLAVDAGQGILYAGQEVVGVWKLPIPGNIPDGMQVINVPADFLMEKVKSFGMPYAAIPDDGEYGCEYGDTSTSPGGSIIVAGNAALAGQHIEADSEGISVVEQENGKGYVIISSQGDDTLQVFERGNVFVPNPYLGEFNVEGVKETDGVHVVAKPFGSQFPDGLMVVQNGDASGPADASDINGYEYDGSTQFKFVNFKLPF
ncbi:MAG: phytase [Methylovulum sp.]|nr:phytase [Methylovulum sp.]